MLQVVTQDKWPIDAGPYGHCHPQSYFMFTSAAHPFESTVGTLHSFNIMLLPAQTTPMTLLYAGELMKETNLKLQVFHNGLRQASRQCRHREVPIRRCLFHPTSIVSYSCVNCYTCPHDNSHCWSFYILPTLQRFLSPALLLPPLKLLNLILDVWREVLRIGGCRPRAWGELPLNKMASIISLCGSGWLGKRVRLRQRFS